MLTAHKVDEGEELTLDCEGDKAKPAWDLISLDKDSLRSLLVLIGRNCHLEVFGAASTVYLE